MSNLTRFNPFKTGLTRFDPLLTRFDPFRDFNDMFNNFMINPMFRAGTEMEPQIRMDVKESDGKYVIKAEIPGVRKEDIHVTIDGNRVSISAETKQEKETKDGERVIRSERSYGLATRSFNLAEEIDQNKTEAKYTDGVLELTLPKKPGAARKEIAIS
jgi:HSP20 family protein